MKSAIFGKSLEGKARGILPEQGREGALPLAR